MIKEKCAVHLRQRAIKNGGTSLYLDIYHNGQRYREPLHLYLNPPVTQQLKDRNKQILHQAEVIRAQRLQEVEFGGYTVDMPFVKYCRKVIEDKKSTTRNEKYVDTLNNVVRLWENYAGSGLTIRSITPDHLRGFIRYLRFQDDSHYYHAIRKSGRDVKEVVDEIKQRLRNGESQRSIIRDTGLSWRVLKKINESGYVVPEKFSENTIKIYLDRIGTFLKRAQKEGYLIHNPMDKLDPYEKPKPEESKRAYLTLDEVRLLAATPMKYENVKRAFLFSCFTGLRHSDVIKLTWEDVDSGLIHLVQQKTGRIVTVPVSDNARAWLPKPKSKTGLVFGDQPPLPTTDKWLARWAESAGIKKHVTFHVSRHTFATLALTYGADIYTVSKLLGHTLVSTTEIYAKVVDEKKVDAVNSIPQL